MNIRHKSKKEVNQEKIDNSSNLLIYKVSINKVASGFAENIAREEELKRINCPGFDFGVRMLAIKLLEDNIIKADDLFKYLKENSYRKINEIKDNWWTED